MMATCPDDSPSWLRELRPAHERDPHRLEVVRSRPGAGAARTGNGDSAVRCSIVRSRRESAPSNGSDVVARDALNARRAGKPLGTAHRKTRRYARVLAVSRGGQRDARDDELRRLEARRHVDQVVEADDEQRRRRRAARATARARRRPARREAASPAALPVPPRDSSFSDIAEPLIRGGERRQHAEEQAGRERHDHRRAQHANVDAEPVDARAARRSCAGSSAAKRRQAPRREQHAGRAAGGRDDQALGQHLLHEPTPRCADRGADRHLLLPAPPRARAAASRRSRRRSAARSRRRRAPPAASSARRRPTRRAAAAGSAHGSRSPLEIRCASRAPMIRRLLARASSAGTPSRSRPTLEEVCRPQRRDRGRPARAARRRRDAIGHQNCAGSTPMISKVWPSKATVRPTTDGSAPKRRRHSASLSRTTRCRPTLSSSARKSRPSAGVTPMTRKEPGVTSSGRTRSGSPIAGQVVGARWRRIVYAAIAENEWLSRRQSK